MKSMLPAIMAMVATVLPQMVVAQSPSDWQNTANYIRNKLPDYPGCESLQWIGLESDCKDTDVPKYCKGDAIASARPQYEQAERMVKNRGGILTGIEANKSKASSETDPTKKSEWEAKKSEGEKKLAELDSEFITLRGDLEKHLRDAEACATARGEIGKVFLRAADKADGVSDAAAKSDAQYCRDQWRDSDKKHRDERINVNIIIEDCKSGIQVIDKK